MTTEQPITYIIGDPEGHFQKGMQIIDSSGGIGYVIAVDPVTKTVTISNKPYNPDQPKVVKSTTEPNTTITFDVPGFCSDRALSILLGKLFIANNSNYNKVK
jgi:hypothetical protein